MLYDARFGVNAFADYHNGDNGAFWRASPGGEFRHKHFAAAKNYYLPLKDGQTPGANPVFSRRGRDVMLCPRAVVGLC